eukprot:gene8793-32690_t
MFFEYLDATSTKGGALPSFLRNGFQGKYYCQDGVPVVDNSEAESTDVETEDEDESDSYDGPFAQMKGL